MDWDEERYYYFNVVGIQDFQWNKGIKNAYSRTAATLP
jgi:hypothetical protein